MTHFGQRSVWGRDHGALLVALLCSLLLVTYPIFDFDLYWHLANGREMFNAGRIVSEEVFSYTHSGDKFANHEWLGQVIFFLLWDQLGPYGLMGFKLLLVTLLVWTLYRTLRNADAQPGIAALLCIMAVLAGINRYHERPELFSLFSTTLLGFVLYGFRGGRLPRHMLWLIPLILLVWDWLHGAVYGLTFLTLFVLGENAKWLWLRQRALAAGDLKHLNRCFAATILVMLINPLGLRSYGIFVGYVVGEADFNQVITEFTPVSWDEFKVFILLFVWCALLALRNWRRMDVTQLLLMVVFGGAALRFNRVSGVAAIVLVPIVATLLQDSLSRSRDQWEGKLHRATLVLAGFLILSQGYLVKFGAEEADSGKYHMLKLYDQAFGYRVDEDFYPVGAVNFMLDQGITGNLYNSGNLGGYLSYRITPERKIFQYNMGRVFGDPFYFVSHPDELAKWNIEYAIVDTESELATLFPEHDWAEVYRDEASVLLVKRIPKNEDLIRQYEIHYFYPVLSDASLRERAHDAEIAPRLIEEMGDSLAYREDERISRLWAELLESSPDLRRLPRIPELLAMALKYNHAEKLQELASFPEFSGVRFFK
ncbi:MAG: hypothetical protein HYZ46_08030 [Nitrosomonadales bacterium]|nr:hypothetical protein [Nitrosomonadales bacterium]